MTPASPLPSMPRKIALVGNEGVGKSALVQVFLHNDFPLSYRPTFEDTYSWHSPEFGSVLICDTAGAPAFDRLRPFSYEGVQGFLVCFAVDERRSFRDIEEKWLPEIKYFTPSCTFALVATKVDLRHDRAANARLKINGEIMVTTEEGQKMAENVGATHYLECSAKTKEAIIDVFKAGVESPSHVKKGEEESNAEDEIVTLSSTSGKGEEIESVSSSPGTPVSTRKTVVSARRSLSSTVERTLAVEVKKGVRRVAVEANGTSPALTRSKSSRSAPRSTVGTNAQRAELTKQRSMMTLPTVAEHAVVEKSVKAEQKKHVIPTPATSPGSLRKKASKSDLAVVSEPGTKSAASTTSRTSFTTKRIKDPTMSPASRVAQNTEPVAPRTADKRRSTPAPPPKASPSVLRKSPSIIGIGALETNRVGQQTQVPTRNHPVTELKKRTSISSLWKREPHPDKQMISARSVASTIQPASNMLTPPASPAPAKREKERKIPVWERLTAVAKKKSNEAPSIKVNVKKETKGSRKWI
ncbi:small GTP-binding protein domain [Spizellomyces punctatus DAOM BR117]|uniref:Small GTP-binding protein domain n=1 Tax=Spizellomyces punctatus (strain DAOM BR117) TaxID=645134 RepID=A0A0L0HPJ3_SPIPD|nr:small GTP-binding protein domain [Spizellomyces punctatus DAOM BR117]KND02978.1 small GTP-binding protein domain [Spizellomyces punctatus DAOM BR117]|eukprot:XP_016611017.1 small GTP-binding protein domain [Spizellomyces punctatus DAOM BR117]